MSNHTSFDPTIVAAESDFIELPIVVNSAGEIIYGDYMHLKKMSRIAADRFAEAIKGTVVFRKFKIQYEMSNDFCHRKECWRPAGVCSDH